MDNGLASQSGRAALALASAFLLNSVGAATPGGDSVPGRSLYVETNDSLNNQVLVYRMNGDGALTWQASVPTGGAGNGGGLGQGALAFSEGQRLLFAVNAGSNTISVFQTGNNGLQLLETVSSLGIAPISITAHDDVVYVLNSGGVSNIAGFRWDWTAGLQPIAGSVHGLSQASPSAVQVGFDPKGDALVVTEKATNMIDVFPVDDTGLAGSINSFVSAGNTPFGFAFALYGTLVVSNANGGINNASSASTYKVLQQQSLETLSSAVPTNQTAACWAAVTHNGRFAYVADAGSSALTGYSLRLPGTLSLLNANGRTASTDPHPIDMAVSFDDRFLYVVSNNGGAIDEFAIKSDGTLWPLGSITGLPTSISGAVTD